MVALETLEDMEDFREIAVGKVPLVEVECLFTLLHVISVGCVVIWHVTIPIRLLSHKVVVVHQDPGNKTQEIEDEDSKFVLEAWMSCMMPMGTNT